MTLRHRKNHTRDERETMVLTMFAIEVQHKTHNWLTSNQIAQRVEMARCGRFKAMLDDMVLSGVLICRVDPSPKHWPGYQYKLAPGTYQEPRPRMIKLSARGFAGEVVFE